MDFPLLLLIQFQPMFKELDRTYLLPVAKVRADDFVQRTAPGSSTLKSYYEKTATPIHFVVSAIRFHHTSAASNHKLLTHRSLSRRSTHQSTLSCMFQR